MVGDYFAPLLGLPKPPSQKAVIIPLLFCSVLNQSRTPDIEHELLRKEQPLSVYSKCCNQTNPTEPARTVPPRDLWQAGTHNRSRSPEKLQLLCGAGNPACYAANGTMESPADKTGKSGVQQTHAKSLKDCFWRKDKLCWQLGSHQKAELKPAKLEKNKGVPRT